MTRKRVKTKKSLCKDCQFEKQCQSYFKGSCKSFLPKIIKEKTDWEKPQKVNGGFKVEHKKSILNENFKAFLDFILIVLCILGVFWMVIFKC